MLISWPRRNAILHSDLNVALRNEEVFDKCMGPVSRQNPEKFG